MISITLDSIHLTRGDSATVVVDIQNEDGSDYTPETGDTIRFAAKRYLNDGDADIVIDIDPEQMMLEFKPGDTKGLDFGSYFYDVQLTTASGDVYTFANGKLWIEAEVM